MELKYSHHKNRPSFPAGKTAFLSQELGKLLSPPGGGGKIALGQTLNLLYHGQMSLVAILIRIPAATPG